MLKNLNYKLGSYGHLYSRMKDLHTIHKPDILFLGSSHAYRGFDTRIFKKHGYSSFNLGSSSQTPIQTERLLKKYLKKIQPELIIYEVEPDAFASDGVESELDFIANDTIDTGTLITIWKIKHVKLLNTLLYGFFRQFFHLNSGYEEPVQKGDDFYVSGGGYVERREESRKIEFLEAPKSEKQSLNKYQLIAFFRILEFFKENNVPYLLVQAPVTKNFNRAVLKIQPNVSLWREIKREENKKIEFLELPYGNNKFNELMEKIFLENSNYFNFNKILSLNDSLHFYDSHHLNQAGVEIFNGRLIELIENPE